MSGDAHDDGGSHGDVGAPIAFLVLALFCGILVRTLAPKKVPYTVWLLVLGGATGCIFDYGNGPASPMERLVRSWDRIDPHLLLAVFLPVLIFESAYNADYHTLSREFYQILLLAGPGVARPRVDFRTSLTPTAQTTSN